MDSKHQTESPTRAVGIKALAQSLGISIGTVSRALNNRYGINPRTRARILEEARRIGYVPNKAARSLKDRPTVAVGLFFAPFVGLNHEINPTALSFVDMLRRKTEAQSASLQTIFFEGEASLKRQAEGSHLDVAIFYGQFTANAFETIHNLGLPAVILHFHSHFPDQVSIIVDMKRAASSAVEYLAALGHERIGIVTGPHAGLQAALYQEGFRESLAEFRLRYRPEWDFELPAERANKMGASEALAGLLRSDDRPTALIFASDWMALGGRLAARQAGLRIPEDISIIGFENTSAAAEVDPPLTTFDVHLANAAEMVVDLAMKLSDRRRDGLLPETREILMSAELIKRQSCACLRKLA